MSVLSKLLDSGSFVVTAELNPPKGVAVQDVLSRGEALKGVVDAVNLTDQATSVMSMSPLALAPLVMGLGLDVVLQVTCRDRNRIAIQGDLLGASALGVENILCLTGDPVSLGDHPGAKTVFDMTSVDLLRTAKGLSSGKDMAGNKLKGTPTFNLGAVVNPCSADLDTEVRRMQQKVEAGAKFFQTQAVFDLEKLERFMHMVRPMNVPVVVGIMVLKSGAMARNVNASLPGIDIPDRLIEEMDNASDGDSVGVAIAGRLLNSVKAFCNGVHLMTIGRERNIPRVIQAANNLKVD